jgi:redox-sensitive bicupin YhaK (pirin superfamily)
VAVRALAYAAAMTNLEVRPVEQECAAGAPDGPQVLAPRDVPLGGPRAMTVRRTLPHRSRSMVGPFCFLDHYGPDDVGATGGMDVPPHPHTGLQTVTWLFEGRVLHQDSVGSRLVVEPGALGLMTAGRGISHSEEGTTARVGDLRRLHGVQLWTALPESERHRPPAFEHHADLPELELPGGRVRVVMGGLEGVASPARVFSPLVAAQVDVVAGGAVELRVDEAFEHALLVDAGDATVAGRPTEPGSLAYLEPGRHTVEVRAGALPVRAMLVGGAPFGERIVMWWNFVARTHDEVAEARAAWQAGLAAGDSRFGSVPGYDGAALPAPELPNVRLLPRSR